MEKKELGREDVIEALKKIAFGRVNRGVELTYLSEPTAQLIRKMDLSAVAEFKRNANGTVEVKFVDRVKALSALYEDRKSTRLNSSHREKSRMPSSA